VEDLLPAEAKIESFLTDLAIHANVAPATQNQAMNALVFLYQRVLHVVACLETWAEIERGGYTTGREIRGLIRFVRESITSPWLNRAWIVAQLALPIQLRLL
jgi:hypothetical protein